jgi:hypothetical protein
MKPFKFQLLPSIVAALFALAGLARAQLVAYDDAGNYLLTANWTNGANAGFGFTPWAIVTNGPDFHGTYVATANNPAFVIASVTNVLGTNYTAVWATFANGTNDINETVAYRGFTNSLGTNTFKLQWGSRGAGVTTTLGSGTVHGWCGFTLRNGNVTNSTSDFQTQARFYLYFLDGAAPSTIYIWDGNGVQSVPNTSFSDLGRANITNAIEAEVTPGTDGTSYHLVLKDCVVGRTIYTLDSSLLGSGTIDSAALFNHETTGDQVYNRMQIAIPHVPPTVVNLQPTNGSIYLDASVTSISFEVKSLLSTIASNTISVSLNGVAQPNLTFSTAAPTNDLLVACGTTIAPDTFYTCTIIAKDANGDSSTNISTFNTFLATDLYIDCGDYNYTNGLFINSSTPANAYANLIGTQNIDYFDTDPSGTNNIYRPGDLPQILSLNTDSTGDPVPHAGGGFTIYSLGFTDVGEWQNYTRTLPASANYSIYARASSAAGGQFEIEELVNATATTTNQPLAALGRVNVPASGGSKVCSGQLTPLTDFFGNTVLVPLSGTKTFRCTAISSRSYNLEYLAVVAVTNAVGTLRPYLATGSPTPGATGVGLTSPITFTLAYRQTTAPTNAIQMILNSTNVSSRLVISSNLAGVTVSWTPTNNLPSNYTNLVTIIFTDSAGVNVTNSWNFITGTSGGVLGSGIWSGGGGSNDMFWADGINWTGGTPGPGFNAAFANPGATTTLATNNIVATNVTIQALFYETNNSGYHTTWIQDGVTLTVTNGTTSTTPVLQAGAGVNADIVFNSPVTNTISGNGGSLLLLGNPQSSGLANQLNFQVRQCASPAVPNVLTLDMSGLGTLVATVGKFTIGQGGASLGQSNVSARVYLARTNVITLLRAVSGQFALGDSSGATNLPGSTLNLGITNSFYMDTMFVGNRRATNNLMRFNPAFTNITVPAAYIRGSNGLAASRVTSWNVGDASTETFVPVNVQANIDFSGGKLDALVGTMVVGRGATVATDTGFAQGTVSMTAGTLDVTSLQVGVQRAVNTATATGVINVKGTATLASTNIILAQTNSGANVSFVTGTINVTNGTVRGNIFAGGGVSTVNLNAGTLIVSNNVGSATVPLTTLNLSAASLHLKADGNATNASIYAASVGVSGTTTITIDSVANVSSARTNHLINYAGASPYAGLALAPMPSGYTGSLVDSGSNIDLIMNVYVPTQPTIRNFSISSGQVIIGGTNNFGAGGTYSVLTSTNLTLALTNWTVLTNGTFDVNGNFSSTNAAATNSQQFYLLRVP